MGLFQMEVIYMPRGRKPGFKHSAETKAKMRGKKKPYTE